MRVLVIEDDALLGEAIAATLADAGHEVSTARDGDAATNALSGSNSLPEVILLDLMMADSGGQRFRQRQLADPRLAPIPTLLMTGRALAGETRAAVGAIPILRKPFALDTLVAAIQEVVQPQAELKQCHCCCRVYDEEGWRALPKVGEIDNGREVGERLELRQCECKSTLAWELGPHALSVPILRARREPTDQ